MKVIRKLLIGLLVIIVLVAGSMWVVVTYYKKELVAMLAETLQTNYGLKLEAEKVRVSLFSNWPHASVQLNNVSLSSAQGKVTVAVKARSLAISFNIQKMLRKEFIVQNVSLRNAEIRLTQRVVKEGVTPKHQATQKPSTPIRFELNKLALKNTRFIFYNEVRGQNIRMVFRNNTIRLKQYANGMSASVTGALGIEGLLFKPGRGVFFAATEAQIDLQATYLNNDSTICVQPASTIVIEEHLYQVASLVKLGANKRFALLVEGNDVDFKKVGKLLAPRIAKAMEPFKVDGPLVAKALITQHIGAREDPVMIIDVTGRNNTLHIGDTRTNYSKLDFKAQLISLNKERTQGEIEAARLIFKPVKGYLNQMPFTATVTVYNLTDPYLTIGADLQIEAAKMRSEIGSEFKLRGSASAHIDYHGSARKLSKETFLAPHMYLKAGLTLNNFSYQEINRPYVYTLNGRANANNHDLQFDKLKLTTDFGKATLKGKVEGFVNFVLGFEKSLKVTLTAQSDYVNLNPLFISRQQPQPVNPADPGKESTKRDAKKQPSQFEFNVQLLADKITVRKVEATRARINLHYKNNLVTIRSMQAGICRGNISMKATVEDFRKISGNAVVRDVDVNEMFQSFENFGQRAITADNLQGSIWLETNFGAGLDEKMEIVPATMSGDVNLRLTNGHLINFEPIQNLSNFLFKNRDFNDVSFSELDDSFVLRGYEMEIHELEISSNLLDLYVVDGVYNFKGNSNINLLVPWHNLKKRGKDFIPKNSGKAAEDAKGLKINFSGPASKMKINLGHRKAA